MCCWRIRRRFKAYSRGRTRAALRKTGEMGWTGLSRRGRSTYCIEERRLLLPQFGAFQVEFALQDHLHRRTRIQLDFRATSEQDGGESEHTPRCRTDSCAFSAARDRANTRTGRGCFSNGGGIFALAAIALNCAFRALGVHGLRTGDAFY